jgi:putative ABC transport system ATP-binding protein
MTPLPKHTPSDAGKPEAVLENISKIYTMGSEEVHALTDFSLTFEQGSFWAILGTSGSGKSTLLNLLGCLDRPTSGRYLLRGRDVSTLNDDDLSEIRLRNIGFIFQSFNLIPQSTVEENIQLPLYYLGIDPAESRSRAGELAAMVGLESRLHHRPMQLSGGQQQRVAIARSLANEPGLLLADEPTGNLDSQTSAEIMRLLCTLNKQGKTIIMVTHEPDIAAFAHKRLYMKDGALERLEG